MKQHNYTKSITTLLCNLKRQYPNKELSVHLYGAVAGYPNGEFWGISDKELFTALEQYAEQLTIDEDTDDIRQIYEDAKNLLDNCYDEEDDY